MSNALALRCWYCVHNSLSKPNNRIPYGPFFTSYQTFGEHLLSNHIASYDASTSTYRCPFTGQSFSSPQDLHISWEQDLVNSENGIVHKVVERDAKLLLNQQRREAKPRKKKVSRKKKRTGAQVARGSRLKGKNFERYLCRVLSNYWNESDIGAPMEELPFRRTPFSGADNRFPLDLQSPLDFPWLVESKNREGANGLYMLERYLKGTDYPPMAWLLEAERRMDDAGVLMPVLVIAKRNNFEPLIFMRPRLDTNTGKFLVPAINEPKAKVLLSHEVMIMTLSAFTSVPKAVWITWCSTHADGLVGYPNFAYLQSNPDWRDRGAGKWRK